MRFVACSYGRFVLSCFVKLNKPSGTRPLPDVLRDCFLQELLKEMLALTVRLYRAISWRLLPVPSRPHYIFNMRHVARIFQSILTITEVQRGEYTAENAALLWAHESIRVFSDGLLDDTAKRWFRSTLINLAMSLKGPKSHVCQSPFKDVI